MGNCCDPVSYNKFSGISNIGYKILYYLIMNNEDLWKLLYYDTQDALSKPALTTQQKRDLIYDKTDDSEDYKIFRTPFVDDAFQKQCSQLRIYISSVDPVNSIKSSLDVTIECITHIKLTNLDNYQSRSERLMEEVLGTLNGKNVGSIGYLYFDQSQSPFDSARPDIFNNRYFYGYRIRMSLNYSSPGDLCDE